MSVIGEDILGKKIDKKRVLGIVLIALLLISMFAFSTVLLNLLFGIQRYDFNDSPFDEDEKDEKDLTPYFPLQDFNFSDIDPEDLEDILDLLDGEYDDFDLSQFSEALLALLASALAEEEVFRVYGYSDFNEMDEKLWKYECYDQYTGTDWSTSVPMLIDDFYTFNNYSSQYWYLDLLKIKMALSPNVSASGGRNSLAIPSLFPIPFIIKESFDAINNLSVSTLINTELYKNLFNATKADLFFSSNDDVNLTYNLFGLDLRSNDEINSLATTVTVTNATQKYLDLLTMYTQIPPNLQTYLTNNQYFEYHYDILNNTIINENDNAFVIANKIRNYLQTNFYLNYTPSPDPGRDAVDWFCEKQQGLWPDFASAFTLFSRAFGVASRFVAGFNSRWITPLTENGEATFAIKYKNLYNWAEIYVPFDTSGKGEWVQMDILFDSYGPGGNPITGNRFNITVTSDQLIYNRNIDEMKLTATLIPLGNYSAANRTISFTDRTSNQILGVNVTDNFGITKISVPLDNTSVVGPHIIEARYDAFSYNYTVPAINGTIGIDLKSVFPAQVNRSDAIPDETNVGGYVYDPVNKKRVKNAMVNFILLHKVPSIEEPFAFTPSSQITGNNGEFDTTLSINPSVPSGQYEIRVDFNGTWILYGVPYPQLNIDNSSNTMDLNITKALSVWFYINNTSADNPNIPVVSRDSTLNLTAKVILGFSPKPGKEVFFYDYSRGGIEIGRVDSDSNGIASITYNVSYCISGPNLLFARVGIQENYSYFIVDDSPMINIISGPNPRVINRTGGGNTTFNIIGNITDAINSSRPLSYSEVALRLISDGFDNSSYLLPFESYPYQTGPTGTFDLTFAVNSNTPTGNYTLRMDFNGVIDLTSNPYPYTFNLVSLSSSAVLDDQLKVETPAVLYFDFWINGYPSSDINNPIINRGDALYLSVLIQYGSTPIPNGEWVDFYDITQEKPIDSVQTISGYANASYPIGNISAGPHLIYAKWRNNYHYSYFILDAPISINLDVCPQPPEIYRSGTDNRTFIIHGFLNDSYNHPIKYDEITVHLFDGLTDVSHLLNLMSGSLVLDESGEIDLTYQVLESTPAKNYTLEVWFDGWFDYSSSNYPHYFNLVITNFTSTAVCVYDLKVIDPANMSIYLFVDGNATRSFYDDLNPPERYDPGDQITFTVIIKQGENNGTGTVTITDVYKDLEIGSYTYMAVDNGSHEFNITTTDWHAGLHKIKVEWDATPIFNTTYVIINEMVNIFTSLDKTDNSIIRNFDSFSVDGNVLESGEYLRGLVLEITLLDSSFSDVSFYLIGSQTQITDAGGYYQFFNFIDISCPQGEYYIRIEFNGGIQEAGISLSDYMVHNTSSEISIKIIAGTYIIGYYDTLYDKEDWYFNDELWVYGYLYWDNGTPIKDMYINATVRDGNGNILETALSLKTDAFGFFNVTFTVGAWEDDTEVWVYFYPEDILNFGPDGTYVQIIQQQVFRPP